jgi:L-lactate dehydrogenase complex protein LldF
MNIDSMNFRQAAARKIHDKNLQHALLKAQEKFVIGRKESLDELDNLDEIRDAATEIRERTIKNLDAYLEYFEEQAVARGAHVHWASTVEDANRIIVEIARQHNVQSAVKSKSMVSEECRLNDALEAAGINVVESDLAEYVLQLGKEPPSHIVAPIVHKTKEEVADIFAAHHGGPEKTTIRELCDEAREQLRPVFLAADMGISGANFFIAETGSTFIVTNEGNGRMVTTLPRVHVALTGIEKVVPTLDDLATLLRLLPRYAAGQWMTQYNTMSTGVRAPDESDGPEHFHIVLLDAGRSRLLGTELQDILRCIRCGACMNHCPVYQSVGGHPYGWVYPGPMGAVLTPMLAGLDKAVALPHAATMCGQCNTVCPVKIPLTDLLRNLRERTHAEKLNSFSERIGLKIWGRLARSPWLYRTALRLAAIGMTMPLGIGRWLQSAGPLANWTAGRDFPPPASRSFFDVYRSQQGQKR